MFVSRGGRPRVFRLTGGRPSPAARRRASPRSRPLAGSRGSAWATASRQSAGQVGAHTGRAAAHRPGSRGVSTSDTAPNGWPAASASQSITPTDQTSLAGVPSFSLEPLGRDVGQRARHVAGGGKGLRSSICARPKSSRRTEIASSVREQDVRGLDVAMDDSAPRARAPARPAPAPSPRRSCPRARRGESPRGTCARDVLVRDIDVAPSPAKSWARRQRSCRSRGGAGLALGARAAFPSRARSSARPRCPCARPGRATPNRSRRCRAAATAGSGRARGAVRSRASAGYRSGVSSQAGGEVLPRRSGRNGAQAYRGRSPMRTRDDDIEFDFFEDGPRAPPSENRGPRRPPSRTGRPGRPAPAAVSCRRRASRRCCASSGLSPSRSLSSSCWSSGRRAAGAIKNGTAIELHGGGGAGSARRRRPTAANSPSSDDDRAQAGRPRRAASPASSRPSSSDLEPRDRASTRRAAFVPRTTTCCSRSSTASAGLRGLADVFSRRRAQGRRARPARLLSDQAERLAASDVVWADRFRAPALQVLTDEGISGVVVPESHVRPERPT